MAKQIIGSRIVCLDRISSTNAFVLKEMKEHSFPEGCVVVALNQYAGQGADVNTWESEPGKNLTFSIILYPDFLPLEYQFMLNKMASLGLFDYVSRLPVTEPVAIKWPNDLYIGNKKAAGILINNMILGSSLVSTVLGIGLNINQQTFLSGAPNPVSLKNATGRDFDLSRCLTDLCYCLDRRYQELKKGCFIQMDDEYFRHQFRRGSYFPFQYQSRQIVAKIEDVDEMGRLVVTTTDGKMIRSNPKEITYIL
ncbi:MAG: biotin--[acetyl-CoA-carboxylase] ligase [Bacteroidales bacterium]|nr:biotin--[acetyl-CoA-carboxylase] ligase [Bacteroidales bacterium]